MMMVSGSSSSNNNNAKVEVGSWDSSVFEFEQDQADQVSSNDVMPLKKFTAIKVTFIN